MYVPVFAFVPDGHSYGWRLRRGTRGLKAPVVAGALAQWHRVASFRARPGIRFKAAAARPVQSRRARHLSPAARRRMKLEAGRRGCVLRAHTDTHRLRLTGLRYIAHCSQFSAWRGILPRRGDATTLQIRRANKLGLAQSNPLMRYYTSASIIARPDAHLKPCSSREHFEGKSVRIAVEQLSAEPRDHCESRSPLDATRAERGMWKQLTLRVAQHLPLVKAEGGDDPLQADLLCAFASRLVFFTCDGRDTRFSSSDLTLGKAREKWEARSATRTSIDFN